MRLRLALLLHELRLTLLLHEPCLCRRPALLLQELRLRLRMLLALLLSMGGASQAVALCAEQVRLGPEPLPAGRLPGIVALLGLRWVLLQAVRVLSQRRCRQVRGLRLAPSRQALPLSRAKGLVGQGPGVGMGGLQAEAARRGEVAVF